MDIKKSLLKYALSPMRPKQMGINKPLTKLANKSEIETEVELLVDKYNDKAFVFDNGRVDILKNGNKIIRKFPNKKDAYLYLLKTGWTYVR
jgi:hypothetical protein